MKRFAVIMAGGSGTRLWPKSTKAKPKQLQAFTDEKTLIQMTWDRLDGLIKPADRSVVTTQELAKPIQKQLATKKAQKVWTILEPEARNTMAAVCLSVWQLHKKDPKGSAVILPADAFIADDAAYRESLQRAFDIAEKHGRIVCLGLKPTFAATIYGYIESGDNAFPELGGKTIKRFVEKPDQKRAEEYFFSGRYSWNAGIFVFKTAVFVEEVRKHAPVFAAAFDQIIKKPKQTEALYKTLPKESVDIALMEKTNVGAVISGDFGWNDLGSWPALEEVKKSNSPAGLIRAPAGHECVEASGNIADVTSKKFLALVGVKDLIIVETENTILVCHKSKAHEIKTLVGKVAADPKRAKKLL